MVDVGRPSGNTRRHVSEGSPGAVGLKLVEGKTVSYGAAHAHMGLACAWCESKLKSGMRRENLSLTKWWWWCRSCAAHCHTRGISAEAEAAGRGDTRGWPLNIGKTIAAGNTHTSLLDRCYVVNVFVSITDVFFFNSALCWLVWARHNHKLVLLREWFFYWCVFWGPCHLRSGHWRGEANKHASYLALVFK